MKSLLVALLSLSLLPCLVAQTATKTTAKSAAKHSTKTTAASIAKAHQAEEEKQLAEIHAQLEQQQALIRQQQEQIEQLQSSLSVAQKSAAEQSRQVQAAVDELRQQNAAAKQSVESSIAEVKTSSDVTAKKLQAAEKQVSDLEEPSALHFKGITLTPGGFIDVGTLYRSRNENSDMSSNFAAVPYGGTANAALSEFRESARTSRLSLLATGMMGKTKLSGYFEVDFMAQAPTANQIETNAFSPRLRQGWLQAELPSGWTFSAGEFWSLVTTNRKSISLRSEFIPNTIEASYVVGYNYVRQSALRITKKSADGRWTTAFEVANPETTYKAAYLPGGTSATTGQPTNIFGLNTSTNASSPTGSTIGYLAGSTNGFSTNLSPDLLAKVSIDPKWGHYEIKALLRTFRDRTNPSGAPAGSGLPATPRTNVSVGGGLGFAAIMPLVAKKLDFIAEGLGGAGIGRYSSGVNADVTLRPDGVLVPLHAYHALIGLEAHATPKLDFFFYSGDEYIKRAPYVNPLTGGAAGYGSPLITAATVAAATKEVGAVDGLYNKNVYETTIGVWYKFYKGSVGTFQYGMQYEFLGRTTWSTQGGAPKGRENVALASFRYILP